LSAISDAAIDPAADSEERTKTIERVISAYTPSGKEEVVAKILHKELEAFGLDARIDGVGNIICEIGSGRAILLLCGHMDTVPGELDTKQVGDLFYGRGACDAKGALLSLLFAFEDLSREKTLLERGKIIFAGVTEEERSSSGLMELIREDVRAKFAIFGEPGGLNRVTVGYRGHVTTHLEVTTREAHASAPKLSTNSVELLFEIYRTLKENLGSRGNESVDSVSVSITEISGGSAHNTIPGRAVATMDVRVPIGKTTDQIRDSIESLASEFHMKYPDAGISVSFEEPTEPYSVRLDSPLVRAINRSILKTGEKPALIKKSGTGDMNTYATSFGSDSVTYGPGEASLSHTPDERISINEIFGCSKIVVKAARELFAFTEKSNKSTGVTG
jgi:[amino group carrier protein]-lysine/ornithine hydrolase